MDNSVAFKIDAYFTRFKHQIYKKGEILIRADDWPQGVYYLKNGIVKIYAISKKGEELVLNIFKPISFFPMSWAMNNTVNTYYYEALTDSEVWRAPKEEAVNFIKDNPDVLYDLTCRVFKGTDGLLRHLSCLMAGDATDRLVSEMIIHLLRFGGKSRNGIYSVRVTEKELASQTGMSRETISRKIKSLRKKALVSYDSNILTVTDLYRLENG